MLGARSCTMATSTSGRQASPALPRTRAAAPSRRSPRRACATAALPNRGGAAGGGPPSPGAGPDSKPLTASAAATTTTVVETVSPPTPPTQTEEGAAASVRGREAEARATRRAIDWLASWPAGAPRPPPLPAAALDEAYAACGTITADYAKTFYLGTKLMTPDKARAIWAIYVWCRRTDELVDGPNAPRMTPAALDRWEERLEAVFEGRPYDILDAALTDTVARFAVDIQPFRDMIDGMRMDLTKARYATYDELYDYCYKVAGTVGLMTTPVMGVDPLYTGPTSAVLKAALALGTANQLTNILRDVGEDAVQRNRVYVPLEDLEAFGIAEQEVARGTLVNPVTGSVDDRWVRFMRFQIERARACFADAEAGVGALAPDARWPVWSALILYRQILDAIEANGYDNFTRRAYVPKWRKYASLPAAALAAARPAAGVGR